MHERILSGCSVIFTVGRLLFQHLVLRVVGILTQI